MRQKTSLLGSLILILIVSIVLTSTPSISHVQANNLLQDKPRLDGRRVYFTEMDAEANRFDRTDTGLSRLASLVQILGADLQSLNWRGGIPTDADLIIIAGPNADYSAYTAWLWSYLQQGGRLLLLIDPVRDAYSARSGFFQLTWAEMGIRVRDDIVAIEGPLQTFYPAPVEVGAGQPTSTPAPAFEAPSLITDFVATDLTQHPITAGIENGVTFFGVRSFEVDQSPSESVRITSLAFSSSDFYGETAYRDYLAGYGAEYNIDADTYRTALTLAVAVEDSATNARIVLIGDREFATNGGGLQTSPPYSAAFLYPDNVRFLLNAIMWLLDTEGDLTEISFPTPGPTATPTITPSPMPGS